VGQNQTVSTKVTYGRGLAALAAGSVAVGRSRVAYHH
jgi:hypothetical protein